MRAWILLTGFWVLSTALPLHLNSKEPPSVPWKAEVCASAISQDGRYLAFGFETPGPGKYNLFLWDLNAGKEVAALYGHQRKVTALHFLADGKSLLSVSQDNTIRVWDLLTGKQVRCIELGKKNDVLGAFPLSDSKSILVILPHPEGGSAFDPETKSLLRWMDLESGRVVREVMSDGGILRSLCDHCGVRISPNGHFICEATRLFDVRTGKLVKHFIDEESLGNGTFSPDGKYLIGDHWVNNLGPKKRESVSHVLALG